MLSSSARVRRLLPAMGTTLLAHGDRYRVDTFNPASNRNQASILRLINLGAATPRLP